MADISVFHLFAIGGVGVWLVVRKFTLREVYILLVLYAPVVRHHNQTPSYVSG